MKRHATELINDVPTTKSRGYYSRRLLQFSKPHFFSTSWITFLFWHLSSLVWATQKLQALHLIFLFSLLLQHHCLGTAQMRWLTGESVRPFLNFKLNFSFIGGLKVNFCIRAVKKMNSSIMASCSPGQALFPAGQNRLSHFLNWLSCIKWPGVPTFLP